jgi:uncharacterized protein YndB with AHSA1/START domain
MTGDLRLVRPCGATRAELWKACATAEGLETWYADKVTGSLSPGGGVRLEWPALGARVDLDVVDWVPNDRVVFADAGSRVTLAVGDGQVSLIHEGLSTPDEFEAFRSSWRLALALLATSLDVHPGLVRRPAWFARPMRGTSSLAHVCFTEAEVLGAWLGRTERIGAEGDECRLELRAGNRLTGKVLVRSESRDLALTWREMNDSVLSFRTFPSPGSAEERVVALCWSRFGPPRPNERAVEEGLRASLDQLAMLMRQSGAA